MFIFYIFEYTHAHKLILHHRQNINRDHFLFVLIDIEEPLHGFTQKFKLAVYKKHSSSCKIRVRASSKDLNMVEIPKQWYNLVADLPLKPPPALHPKTHKPLKFEDLSPLFPDELIRQEVSHDRFIDIPDDVIDIYKLWRPTPLIRFVLRHQHKFYDHLNNKMEVKFLIDH